ncbi:MAG: nitrogen regulatory protein [Chlamydiales bacterium]|jgi:PTS system nitrogen regulatory IIA component|nr:nitrogen regulatory protein [Chlamydiales bacterium]
MDLKIEDVAELLNLSENTIENWLSEGKIPSYQINGQIRFNRLEIEDWMMHQKLEPAVYAAGACQVNAKSNAGSGHFSLYRALNKGGILYDVEGSSKEEVIRNTVKHIAFLHDLDEEVITELLLDRERLMPTALNNGFAIPHAREFLLDTHFDIVALAFPKDVIEYGALDGKPVHTLFFLFATDDKRHLQILAKIAHLISDPVAVDLLRLQTDKEGILEFIKDWENSLHSHIHPFEPSYSHKVGK